MNSVKRFFVYGLLLVLTAPCLSGCQVLVARVTTNLAQDLSSAILNSDDIDTVAEAIPAYLIMVDALLEGNENNASLLFAAAQLYGSYASAFVEDEKRQQMLADKAYAFALQAACLKQKTLCGVVEQKYDETQLTINSLPEKAKETLYYLGSAWAGWIQARSDDMSAVAQLAKVKLIFSRLLELDEAYELGAPHLYMGVFESLVPPSMGGRPEVAKAHFERAVRLSDGKSLYAKVLYAEMYARLIYDRELHDRLLREVIEADPYYDGFTLQNKVAQAIAAQLLESADEYF